MVHIIPPPPKGDNDFIQQYHESLFANEGISTNGVSSPALRMKFWKLQTRVLEDVCKEMGVDLMMPPAASRDPDGFLIKNCYARDATHGNSDYGELILKEVQSRYGEESASKQAAS